MNNFKWFSLDNYSPSKDPSVWRDRVYKRVMILNIIGSSESDLEPADLFLNYLFKEFPSQALKFSTGKFMSIASEMTVGEFQDTANYLGSYDEYRNLESKIYEMASKMGPPGFDFEAYDELRATPLSHFSSSGLFLSIDTNHDDKTISDEVLSAVRKHRRIYEQNDELLDEEFSDFISDVWLATHINKPINDRTFSNWHLYGVLPYWDLKTWSMLAGVKLTHEEASLKIWPDGFGNDETIRKTTRKYTDSVITWQTLNRLQALSD
jgi:hypothetical protein